MAPVSDPHTGQSILHRGPQPDQARLTMIVIHGRGADADDILALTAELRMSDVAYLAPQAAGNTWYPYSFLSPLEKNEPHLSSALKLISQLMSTLNTQGISSERIGLMGFSQGACLSLEFAARNARRYAAVIGLSGGVIGPPETSRDYPGSLAGSPVFLGCSDVDPHIPLERVHETAEVMKTLGGDVDERIYRGLGHTVNGDELKAVTAMLKRGA